LKLAETSILKSRPSVPYGANLFNSLLLSLLSFCLLSCLFTSLLVYFLTYLSTLSRKGPFYFQAGGRRRL